MGRIQQIDWGAPDPDGTFLLRGCIELHHKPLTRLLGPSSASLHDLRHTGNPLAAASGASTRGLMQRMGHATLQAALIHQHATSERDREIASAMDRRIVRQSRRMGGESS
ncbi:hypothetical protein ACTMSW_25035 [Micromonospora sp. BQ11]|uniref:hypothetical protein n=1 Tax=Micromonospora sp. BQ11 TaxID=3452212 RepID=UPI003F8B01F8